jgi:carboxyl-terminal processing protease
VKQEQRMSLKVIFRMLLAAVWGFGVIFVQAGESDNLNLTVIRESPSSTDDVNAYDNFRRLATVMKLLQKLYVDKDKVTTKRLIDGALKGMLHELDPYSSYEPFGKDDKENDSRKAGIGIMAVKKKRSGLKVVCALENSPAAKAGIKVGDLIVNIDGKPTGGLTYQQCADLIRGEFGTQVKLEVIREDKDDPLVFKIKRSLFIKKNLIDKHSRMLKNNIGYVRINIFDNDTVVFLDKVLRNFKKQKCKGVIVDLRNNPGGLVEAAVAFCSRFLKEKDLVITIVGRDPEKIQKIFAEKCENYTKLPLIIIINRFSASASEIVAGSLKDHKRAVLLGSRSFGKGSVQRVCKIKDNGTLRFTVAKYYTPNHNVIHGKGIEPDIKLPLSLKQRLQLAQQLEENPGIIVPAKKDMVADVQLQKAFDVMEEIIEGKKEKNDL